MRLPPAKPIDAFAPVNIQPTTYNGGDALRLASIDSGTAYMGGAGAGGTDANCASSAAAARASSAAAARLGSRSVAELPQATYTPADALSRSQPISRPSTGDVMHRRPPRPGTASRPLPSLAAAPASATSSLPVLPGYIAAPAPASPMDGIAPGPATAVELQSMRQRALELETEVKDARAVAQQYRTKFQAFADTCRMQGLSTPSDNAVAFWEEAQRLLTAAIKLQYGKKLGGQQLSATELKQVRARYEQRIAEGQAMLDHAEAERYKLQDELALLRRKASTSENGSSNGAKGTNSAPAPAPPPTEPMMPVREHEEKLKEVQRKHATELQGAVGKLKDEAAANERAMLSSATSSYRKQELEMQRQLLAAQASAEERAALDAAKAKEERIELLHRQSMRRIANRDLYNGWSAWSELWQAKTRAMNQLRRAGRRLKAPALSSAFSQWGRVAADAKAEAARRAVLKANETLEGQLRFAHYEMSQQALEKAALEDELRGAREKIEIMAADAAKKAAALEKAGSATRELSEMRAEYAEALSECNDAKRRADVAETEAASHVQGSEVLIKKLLDEQRRLFDKETAELRERLEAKTAAQEREARIEVLHKMSVRRMANMAVTRGWGAWTEMRESRIEARNKLDTLGSKLQIRGVGSAFIRWMGVWRERHRYLQHMSKEEQLVHLDRLETELDRVRNHCKAAEAERDELQRRLIEMGGDVEGAAAMIEQQRAAEKERRVELFGRQVLRRIMHAGITRGWTAWHELWRAKVHAYSALKRSAQRLKTWELRAGFEAWVAELEAQYAGVELSELRKAPESLKNELKSLQQRIEGMRAQSDAKLAELAEAHATALANQKIELTGSAAEVMALREEQEKAQRVEMLRKQSMRRMLYAGLAGGLYAWVELWEAKTYAMSRLREIGNRMRKPEIAFAFSMWTDLLAERNDREQMTHVQRLAEQQAELQHAVERLKKELERERADSEAKLHRAEEAKASALQRQLVELTGSAEEIAALRGEEEKEKRIDLLRRQIGRRMLSRGLANGWSAWHELWAAKTYSMARLQQCANRLKEPELANAFGFWAADAEASRKLAEWRELEAQSKSLEAQLRRARYESKQSSMIQTARDDEIRALKAELDAMRDTATEREQKLAQYGHLPDDLERFKAMYEKAREEAQEAIQKREEAEADVLKQLDDSQALLEKLLAEQRHSLGDQTQMLKQKLGEESKLRQANDAELSHLKQVSGEKERSLESELTRLREELKRLTAPPPPKPKARPKYKLGNIDLDEGPDAPPVSEQLAKAIRENSTRVLDLFRSWDADGDGQVSRKEFHKAMPELGLDVPKQVIDDLFTEWDSGGDGAIAYGELRKILQAPRSTSPKSTEKNLTSMKAAGKMLGKLKRPGLA